MWLTATLALEVKCEAVAAESIGKTGYPMLWRQAALAVELCQRAAGITGQVLLGSYRPGGRAAVTAARVPAAFAEFLRACVLVSNATRELRTALEGHCPGRLCAG